MRLRGIGPEVLLLCFLVIGAAAFVLGRRSARARRVRGDTEYFAGLDHLVNDRYDRAAEVFTRLATKSHEAEIQFALGSLMRKRGEVDRAIAIHSGLAENRDPAIREQATLALGLDYMSAGLMDRAEEKLRSLLGSERYRAAALEKLAWVYEQQRDWRAALDLWRELPPEKQTERAADAAHYCCELAEAALSTGELAAARTQLAAARVHAPDGARTRMLAARIAAASGEESRALELYTAALAGSRTMEEEFLQEAHTALGAHAAELDNRLRAQHRAEPDTPQLEVRFRCQQCGVGSVTWHWRCPRCRTWDALRSLNNRGV
ncbi:MAG TPA: tetratricopeptide repeat protein [Steroidobacteraceae bacterium]|nr:tetratricopeptide repeat protein [Steroidobacteraceae bacterium]